MKKSPLRVERYHFTKALLVAAENPEPKAVNNIHCRIDIRKAPPTDDPKQSELVTEKYQITLTVVLDRLEGNVPPYTGEFVAVGYFQVNRDRKTESCDGFAAANGCNILYSAVREMIANLSARGPWPMLGLVTVTFADLLKAKWEVHEVPPVPPGSPHTSVLRGEPAARGRSRRIASRKVVPRSKKTRPLRN